MAKKKDDEIQQVSLNKYLQTAAVRMHPYQAAYLTERFRGILKSRVDWQAILNQLEDHI